MEAISIALEGKQMSKGAIEKAIEGGTDAIRAALDCLVKEGFAKFSHGSRNSLVFDSIKPFRQLESFEELSTGVETA
jgi:hypothetical protein